MMQQFGRGRLRRTSVQTRGRESRSAGRTPTPVDWRRERCAQAPCRKREHEELDRRAVACFDAALSDVGIIGGPLRSLPHDYFAWSAHRMGAHSDTPDSVPDGVPIPDWSWDGLVDDG
jgi:hypothetical protein